MAANTDKSYDFLFKIVLLGEDNVGKTCIFIRYNDDRFAATMSTIGVDFSNKTIALQDKKIKMQIWDTPGQQRYHSMVPTYLRGCTDLEVNYRPTYNMFKKLVSYPDPHSQLRMDYITATRFLTSTAGVMLVYDITKQSTFDQIPYWMEMIKKHGPDIEVLLVGNKCDLDSQRVISTERGQQMASSLGIFFREISPKSGITNVDEAFDTLARCVLAKKMEDEEKKVKAVERSDRCSTM